MEDNKRSIKYNVIMIIWGLLTGPVEIPLLLFAMNNMSMTFSKCLLILVVFAICIKLITYIIQMTFKKKIKEKREVNRNRNFALYFSLISITISFFVLWYVDMQTDSEGSLYFVILMTILYVIVQVPFLLPIEDMFTYNQ